jgi:hypothetical protein
MSMNESPEQMVMRVGQSFAGEPFTLQDAATVMVRLYPKVIPVVFSEGWQSLIDSKALNQQPDDPQRYRLDPHVARAVTSPRPGES